MGLIKSGYPSLSMCRIAAHAAYGGNKPMPQWAFFEVRYSESHHNLQKTTAFVTPGLTRGLTILVENSQKFAHFT